MLCRVGRAAVKDMRFLTKAQQQKKMNKRLSLDGDVSYSSGEREVKSRRHQRVNYMCRVLSVRACM